MHSRGLSLCTCKSREGNCFIVMWTCFLVIEIGDLCLLAQMRAIALCCDYWLRVVCWKLVRGVCACICRGLIGFRACVVETGFAF